MSVIVLVVLVFFALAAGLGGVAYLTYKRKLRRAKAIERGLKMVPILIHLPPPSSDTAMGSRDLREVMREKTAQAEVLYNLIAGTATAGIKSKLYGQRQIALELVATGGVVHFYAAVPVALVSVVKQAILTAYPGATLEEVEDHNIFNQEGRLAATMGGEMVLRTEGAYPIATYKQLERDPLEAILTTLSTLTKQDGVAIQFMLRPADPNWVKRSIAVATAKRKGRNAGLAFTPKDLLEAALRTPNNQHGADGAAAPTASNLELAAVEQIEEKTKHPGFDVLIRVVVSTDSVVRSQQQLRDLATAFALFDSPGLNGFKFLPALDVQGLVTAFIFRFFPPELKGGVLASEELATLFHLPDSQFTPSASVERMQSKQVDGPVAVPTVGLLFGYNEFRGVHKEIRLSVEDRRRHTYILGQTGTGKSTMLENLAVQDMMNGNGFAFIDPHGDSAEKLLALVPKERSEDVIYFNPADAEYPVGLNLFEFNDPAQKDFIVQETINMLYKLYDPGHTGIIGPRYEHWYRNAALTLMSDPNGSTFIEIPKVFTDTEYLKQKFRYLTDPTVIDFWTKEMGQTSDYHKSEMLGWFVSKFGAFMNNEMMRNIIGQTESAFNLRDVMDHKRILIVNLSKGRIGELNSQLLGMIFVIKFQAAAMSRAEVPEDQRPDFSLYVDEFQNFSTDSFASILSEARKYRLNLIVANQFIGQLRPEVRDAVFGNIGTIVAHRMGPDDAEFMVKQFAPVFDAGDLVNIPNYNAAMRLMIGGLPSQPFTIRDSAPLGSPNLALGLAIKQLSAAKFGHAKAQVERDIMTRMNGGTVAAPMAPPAPAPVAPPAVGESVGAQTGSGAAIPGAEVAPVATAGPVVAVPAGALGPAGVAQAAAPMAAPLPPAPQTVAPVVMQAAVAPMPPTDGAGEVVGQFGGAASAAGAPVISAPGSQFAPPIINVAGPPANVVSAPKPVDAAKTLALTDITGGKPPVRVTTELPAAPSRLESGQPLADDPYADLAVLGNAAAPVNAGAVAPPEEPAVVGGGFAGPSAASVAAEPEPRLAPEPALPQRPSADNASAAALPAAEPEQTVESLIHFVDPTAQALLAGSEPGAGESATEGLPEGVTFVDPTAQVNDRATAPLPDAANLLPAAPPIAAASAASTPAPASPPPVAAVPTPGTNVPALNVSLAQALEEQLSPAAPQPLQPAPQSPATAPTTSPELVRASTPVMSPESRPESIAGAPTTMTAPVSAAAGAVEAPVVLAAVPPTAEPQRPEPAPKPMTQEPVAASLPTPPVAPTLAPPPTPATPATPATPPPIEPSKPVGAAAPVVAMPPASPPVSLPPSPAPAQPVAASIPQPIPAAPMLPEVPPAASVAPAQAQVSRSSLQKATDSSMTPAAPSPTPAVASAPTPAPAAVPAPAPPAPAAIAPPRTPAAPTPTAPAPAVSQQPKPIDAPQPSAPPPPVQAALAPQPAAADAEPPVAPERPLPPTQQEEPAREAGDQVTGLLDTSLLDETRPERKHRRLPEPAPVASGGPGFEAQDAEYDVPTAGVAARPAVAPPPPQPKADEPPPAQHHGLKVITPLEPIVPKREELARELAELAESERQAAAQAVAALESPRSVVLVKAAPAPQPTKPAGAPQILKHTEQMMGLPPAPPTSGAPTAAPAGSAPVPAGGFDDLLPQAESLAATDVAEARVKGQPAPLPPVAQQQPAALAPAAGPAPQPPVSNARNNNNKRRRPNGHGRFRNGENVSSAAEAEHNSPTAVEEEAGSLTGKLIMPTAQRPAPAPEPVKAEKPKKLAPGEVFVDDNGNVVIGE